MTADKKVSDVFEKLQENLKNNFRNEFNRIAITMKNVNNTMEDDGFFNHNENYKRVSLIVGSHTDEIKVYFNNFQNISDYLTKIIKNDANFFDEIVDIIPSYDKEASLDAAKKIANFYENKFGWEVKVGFTYRLKKFIISVDDYHFEIMKMFDETFVIPMDKSIIENKNFIKVFGW